MTRASPWIVARSVRAADGDRIGERHETLGFAWMCSSFRENSVDDVR